jgi:hypothetical protein
MQAQINIHTTNQLEDGLTMEKNIPNSPWTILGEFGIMFSIIKPSFKGFKTCFVT